VVVIINNERVPVITGQIELRVAQLVGPGTAYSGNPDLSAINWLLFMIKNP
jgi:hypothetical protein